LSVKGRRLKVSRLTYDLKQYYKECNITGIKEIDSAIARVNASKAKIVQVRDVLNLIKENEENSS
jgi:hypothetical protein